MKKFVFMLVLVFVNLAVQAQSATYQTAMNQALTDLEKANTIADFQQLANQLDRIQAAEPKEWLPGYYAAFATIQMSFKEADNAKRDLYLDKAQQYIDNARQLNPKESEIYALQALLYQGRIQVSPMDRGQKYSALTEEALAKAKALNPENPRAYFLLGQQRFYMPAMFGGGPSAALPILTLAKEKFAAFKPQNSLDPTWGEPTTLYLLEKCRETPNTGK
jgi:cytochrome c-type biogenesis protein CcmH/NrfG